MIIPLVGETDWEAELHGIPLWQPPAVPTLVIAPHPDDETLAAGGLIASLRERNVPVGVVALTDGENAYAGELGLGAVRAEEQTEALLRLGVPATGIHRFRLPDSDVSACEVELSEKLELVVKGAGHVVAPWPHDFHPDHEAAGRVTKALCEKHGVPLTFYFFWTWHRGTPDLLRSLPLRRLELTPAQQHAKRSALSCHSSQLEHHSGEPILPADLLLPAWRSFEIFLPV